jgi:hypothetical protein
MRTFRPHPRRSNTTSSSVVKRLDAEKLRVVLDESEEGVGIGREGGVLGQGDASGSFIPGDLWQVGVDETLLEDALDPRLRRGVVERLHPVRGCLGDLVTKLDPESQADLTNALATKAGEMDMARLDATAAGVAKEALVDRRPRTATKSNPAPSNGRSGVTPSRTLETATTTSPRIADAICASTASTARATAPPRSAAPPPPRRRAAWRGSSGSSPAPRTCTRASGRATPAVRSPRSR